MKVQEAIKILHPESSFEALFGLAKEAGIKLVEEACLMAVEAMEKQIPKKVIFEDNGEVLLCPRCGLDLMGSITEPDHDPYYCFECGQALDWKVEE